MKDFNIKVKFEIVEDETGSFVYLNILEDNIAEQNLTRKEIKKIKNIIQDNIHSIFGVSINPVFDIDTDMKVLCDLSYESSKEDSYLDEVNELSLSFSESFKDGVKILFENDIIEKELELEFENGKMFIGSEMDLLYLYNILLIYLYDLDKSLLYSGFTYISCNSSMIQKFNPGYDAAFSFFPLFYKNSYDSIMDTKCPKEEAAELISQTIYQLLYNQYSSIRKEE